MLKVEIGQKLGPFPEVISQVVDAREKKILKKIKGATRADTLNKRVKQCY